MRAIHLKNLIPVKMSAEKNWNTLANVFLSLKKFKMLTEVIILSEQILQLQVIPNIVVIIKLW